MSTTTVIVPIPEATLEQRAARIKAHLEHGKAIMSEAELIATQDFIEAGKELILSKSMVKHGQWQNWLADNFNLKSSSAKNLMSIAERFSKRQTFGDFSYSQLIQLLPLPATEEGEFLAATAANGTPAYKLSVRAASPLVVRIWFASTLSSPSQGI